MSLQLLISDSDGRFPCNTCVRYEYICVFDNIEATTNQHIIPLASAVPSLQHDAINPSDDTPNPPLDQPTVQKNPRYHHRGMIDASNHRFVRANSAIAAARILAMELDAEEMPRLHSYA